MKAVPVDKYLHIHFFSWNTNHTFNFSFFLLNGLGFLQQVYAIVTPTMKGTQNHYIQLH